MSYKSVKEILNDVFDSSDQVLKGVYKTESEVLNMVMDETGDPALKVRVQGLSDEFYTKPQTDTLLSAKMARSAMSQAIGNLSAPLTHLPLKKNLLTAQGQGICAFTRASTATYVDRYGVLKSSAADNPRFASDGMLIEGASTNLLTYSEQFDNAAWSKGNLSVSANTTETTDPFGTGYADKLIETNTTAVAHSIYQSSVTYVAGTAYAFSVFAKKAERKKIRLSFGGTAFGSGGVAIFDLNDKTQNITGAISARIQELSGGWSRLSVIMTATSSASGASPAIYLINDSGDVSYTGDGTSGLYIFGAQLEAMPFPTSYIPTTTAAATRAYNNISIPQAENLPAFSGDFSIITGIKACAPSSLSQDILSDGNLRLSYSSAGKIILIFGGATITSTTSYSNETIRICIRKNSTTVDMFINGELAGSAAASSVPANQLLFYIGSKNGTSNHFYGTIKNLRIYDVWLTAEEVYAA